VIKTGMDALVWLRKQLETDNNDLLREMVRSFAEELMSPVHLCVGRCLDDEGA
jgi:hypothetical protein